MRMARRMSIISPEKVRRRCGPAVVRPGSPRFYRGRHIGSPYLLVRKRGGPSKGRAPRGATQRPAKWRTVRWAALRIAKQIPHIPALIGASQMRGRRFAAAPFYVGFPTGCIDESSAGPRNLLTSKMGRWRGPCTGQASIGEFYESPPKTYAASSGPTASRRRPTRSATPRPSFTQRVRRNPQISLEATWEIDYRAGGKRRDACPPKWRRRRAVRCASSRRARQTPLIAPAYVRRRFGRHRFLKAGVPHISIAEGSENAAYLRTRKWGVCVAGVGGGGRVLLGLVA